SRPTSAARTCPRSTTIDGCASTFRRIMRRVSRSRTGATTPTSGCRKNREQVPAERDFACPDGSGMAASKVFRSADWSGCKQEHAMELQFISPQQLRPTEEYDSDAALVLSRQIARDGFWRVPILVHRGYLAILDGHHRWQAAIHMRLAMMPCFVCSYAEDNIQL